MSQRCGPSANFDVLVDVETIRLESALFAEQQAMAGEALDRVAIAPGTLRATRECRCSVHGSPLGDMDLLLAHADEAMYAAKRAGRNRTVLWQGPGSTKRRVLKAGRILFKDRLHAVDCTIRSLDNHAAGLNVWNAHDLPDHFDLAIGFDGQERKCKVITRTDKHVEVDFI